MIHEVTLSVHCFQVKLEFEMSVFVEEEKPEDPQKNLWSKDKNQKELNPHLTPGPRIEPRPQ